MKETLKKELDFEKSGGLLPVIVQNHADKDVLMLAYTNLEALEKTISTGFAHYYSRSREKLWLKGESSGHTQEIKEILYDCDSDTLLFLVIQKGGAACHTGRKSCFFNKITEKGVEKNITKPIIDPGDLYK